MGSSFKIFSVRGIDIKVHITFPLILIWAAAQFGYLSDRGLSGALFGVIVVTLLFVIVTLHELGHSFAALYYGVPVEQIVLLPIGGVAQLRRIPEQPGQELVIAIAGPAVNFALAILLWLVAVVVGLNLAEMLDIFGTSPGVAFTPILAYVSVYNLFLGLFNLLPAFPMDGGRVLRALLALRLDYVQATSIAATVGRGLAWLMGLYGFIGGSFTTILVAFFIYIGAGQERASVRTRSVLRGLRVAQAYSQQVQVLQPQSTLQQAVELVLSGFQASFPVCDGDQIVGLLTYPQLVTALNREGPETSVGGVMRRDFPTVAPEDELVDAQEKFRVSQLDALPVVGEGRFLGLITSRDMSEVFNLLTVEPDLLPRT